LIGLPRSITAFTPSRVRTRRTLAMAVFEGIIGVTLFAI
jgi:hypothetical protein